MIFCDRRELLGDPQADIGRAGDERRVGMLRIERASDCSLAGAAKKRSLVADEQIGLVVERARAPAAAPRRCG